MKHVIYTLIIALMAMTCSCDSVNNTEVPNYVVYLDLGSYALWTVYGVSGVGEYRIFDRTRNLPANFSYTSNTYTGFGGVLLIMGLDSSTGGYAPIAFDAACPVEVSASVKVEIDSNTLEAVCPQCGSHYNVLTGAGGPISGQAYTLKYGLRNYTVRQSQLGGYIITS